jgi:ATP-binding cassette subfamily B multidrug efflux pump
MATDHDELTDDEQQPRHLSTMEMVRRVLPLFRPHLGAMGFGLSLLAVSVVAELAGPLVLRHLIDVEIPRDSQDGVILSAAVYAALFLTGTAANYLQVVTLTRMGLTIVTQLKETVFRHLMGLSIAYFDHNSPGRLMARVESDTERLQALFSEVAVAVLRTAVLLAGALAVMMVSNWRVTVGIPVVPRPW